MKNFKLQLLLITLLTPFLSCDKNDTIIEEKNEPYDKNVKVITVQDDVLWVGTWSNGIYKLENESWINYTTEHGILSNEITSILIDNSNCVWIGTKMGVTKFENNTWVNFTTDNGLYSNDVRSLGCDKENNIWIGSNRNRVTKFDGTNFTVYHVSSEFSGDPGMGHIHTITCDLEGNMWIGSCMTGLSVFNGLTWSDFVNGLNTFVEVSTCDKTGAIWIGHYTGAFRYSDGIWTEYTENEGLLNSTILSIDIDNQGNIWVGTKNGISKYDGTTWTNYIINDEKFNEYVSSLACDNNGAIWIGNSEGLLKYAPNL
jgi:ligand-binding sensor domain-containing protein